MISCYTYNIQKQALKCCLTVISSSHTLVQLTPLTTVWRMIFWVIYVPNSQMMGFGMSGIVFSDKMLLCFEADIFLLFDLHKFVGGMGAQRKTPHCYWDCSILIWMSMMRTFELGIWYSDTNHNSSTVQYDSDFWPRWNNKMCVLWFNIY